LRFHWFGKTREKSAGAIVVPCKTGKREGRPGKAGFYLRNGKKVSHKVLLKNYCGKGVIAEVHCGGELEKIRGPHVMGGKQGA